MADGGLKEGEEMSVVAQQILLLMAGSYSADHEKYDI
jgi:hypothetical protein